MNLEQTFFVFEQTSAANSAILKMACLYAQAELEEIPRKFRRSI